MPSRAGVLTDGRNARDQISDALRRPPGTFVYLKGDGYWLRERAHTRAGCDPAGMAAT
jgi:hypothetical protein